MQRCDVDGPQELSAGRLEVAARSAAPPGASGARKLLAEARTPASPGGSLHVIDFVAKERQICSDASCKTSAL